MQRRSRTTAGDVVEQNPVTLFGADATKQGAEEVRQFFHLVASWFTNCTAYHFDLVAAEVNGDLAYTIGFEHVSASFRGGPAADQGRVSGAQSGRRTCKRRSAPASRTYTGERTVSG